MASALFVFKWALNESYMSKGMYQEYYSQILLLIDCKGQIQKLYTPFRVINKSNDCWAYIDKVLTSSNDELIFVIDSYFYPHYNFRIVINF